MIPHFNDDGNLPPGLHRATLEEVSHRFGGPTEIRRVQMESLEWLVAIARKAGVSRLIVNGSFATDEPVPNDVDCVLLIEPGFPSDPEAEQEIWDGLPFLQIEMVELVAFNDFVDVVFATDRAFWAAGSRRVLQAQPASDGKFTVIGLPAGEYYLAAVTRLEPGDLANRQFLEDLLPASLRITIRDGEKKTQDLKLSGGG